jgi:hypothetical protein
MKSKANRDGHNNSRPSAQAFSLFADPFYWFEPHAVVQADSLLADFLFLV